MVDKIKSRDTSLFKSFDNINNAIDEANVAKETSEDAVNTANQATATANTALSNSKSTQDQLDNVIIESGTSDAEVIESRTNSDGKTFTVLRDRLNDSDARLASVTEVVVTYNGVTTTFKNVTTTFHVDIDANVVSGNDGLSSAKPIKLSDIQTIFDALKAGFPRLLGEWTVNFAAGTYQSDGLDHMLNLNNIPSSNPINFAGPDVAISAVPTAIFDGKLNGTQYRHGFYFQDMNIDVTNVKFRNFSEYADANVPTGTRGGLAVSGHKGRLHAKNVHASECSWGGIVNQGLKRLYVEGGLFDSNRYGVLSMFNTEVTVGYNGSSSKPDNENTRLTNNYQNGVIFQSESGGHVDYCIIDGNINRGLQVSTSSDVNSISCKFTNNFIAMSANANSRILNNGAIFSGNNQNYERFNNGIIDDGSDATRSLGQKIDDASNFTSSVPSGGGTFYTETMKAPNFFGRGKMLELEMYGRISNPSANTCDIVIKASDGVNPEVALQTITVPSTPNYEGLHLRLLLSNYTQATFTKDLDFEVPGFVERLITHDSVTLDSTRDITLTFSVVVNGTANTSLDVYRTLSRVIL